MLYWTRMTKFSLQVQRTVNRYIKWWQINIFCCHCVSSFVCYFVCNWYFLIFHLVNLLRYQFIIIKSSPLSLGQKKDDSKGEYEVYNLIIKVLYAFMDLLYVVVLFCVKLFQNCFWFFLSKSLKNTLMQINKWTNWVRWWFPLF